MFVFLLIFSFLLVFLFIIIHCDLCQNCNLEKYKGSKNHWGLAQVVGTQCMSFVNFEYQVLYPYWLEIFIQNPHWLEKDKESKRVIFWGAPSVFTNMYPRIGSFFLEAYHFSVCQFIFWVHFVTNYTLSSHKNDLPHERFSDRNFLQIHL